MELKVKNIKSKSKKIKIAFIVMTIYFATTLTLAIQQVWTGNPKIDYQLTPSEVVQAREYTFWPWLKKFTQFGYFTTLSNVIVCLAFIVGNIFNVKIHSKVKLAIVLYISITSIIFWTALAIYIPWGRSAFGDFDSVNEHLISTALAWCWYIFDKKEKVNFKKDLLLTLGFPFAYLFFSIGMFVATGGAAKVYPFLNFTAPFDLKLALAPAILLSITIIIVIISVFSFVYWLMVFFNNKSIDKKIRNNNIELTNEFKSIEA